MQMINKISQLKRVLFVVLGLLVATYVITEQVCEEQSELINQELSQEADAEEQEKEAPVVKILSLQMLPSVSVELAPFESFFIRELFVDTEEELPFIAAVPLEDTHHFKTLFRRIQSPNAP